MSNSVWSNNYTPPQFEPLKGNLNTEVLIIGGGMAGVLCAHFLQQAGVDYALVEAKRIGGGITKNTTAKVTAQHGIIYHPILKKYGLDAAKAYYAVNHKAVEQYKKLAKEIDCDFEPTDTYVYSLNRFDKIHEEAYALKQVGGQGELLKTLPLPFPVAGALKMPNQGQFHPLKFLSGIAKGLNIYEQTKVKELVGTKAITDGGTIQAKKIIVATHFPMLNKHGGYFIKLYQHRSYVIALENAPNIHGAYVDHEKNGMSFRNYQNLLFVGGGDHRTGKQGGSWQELRNFIKQYYPNAKERYHWATQDCMTLDAMPYIGQYSPNTPDLYVATGFQKWGMSWSMAAAELLCDLVTGKENDNAKYFSPSRSIWHPQLLLNGVEATLGMLTPTTRRCPHLGCALRWNKAEHSWDCTCHGSRFEQNGALIDNPATDDLKK